MSQRHHLSRPASPSTPYVAWMRWILPLLTALLLAVPMQAAHAKKQSSEYGQKLLSTTTLPADVLERFDAFNRSPTLPGSTTTKKTVSMAPNTSNWFGKELAISSKEQPYTIVVKTYGKALADGEVKVRWQLGWERDGSIHMQTQPADVTKGRAGKPVAIVTHNQPTRFKEEKPPVHPFVGFVLAENLKIDRVEVQVWSGVPDAGWKEILHALVPLLIGVVMLAYWFKFLR